MSQVSLSIPGRCKTHLELLEPRQALETRWYCAEACEPDTSQLVDGMVEHSDAYTLNSTRQDGDALHHDTAVVNGPAVYYAGGGGSKRPGRLLRQFGPMFTAVVNGPAVYYIGG